MKNIKWSLLALLIAFPLYSQGLTVTLKETTPTGQTTPMLQTDRTQARLDIPSLASQLLYDSSTQTLRLLVPLAKFYREFTPASAQALAAAMGVNARGQAAPARTTYRRTGTSKVKDWTCTTYEGLRGTEKVAEVCAAEGASINLTAADFTVAQQAIDLAKPFAAPEILERIPVYGTVASQGFAGFPVRRVSFRTGQPDITTELVEIRRGAIPAANFAVPADFNRLP